MLEKKSKKRGIIIGVVVLVIVAVLVVAGVISSSKNNATQTGGSVEKITKRTIANSISGNGVVESASKQEVTGGSYGMKVETVKVEAGDVVTEGQVICVFDTDDIDEQIKDLQQRIQEIEEERVTQNAEYDQEMINADANRAQKLANANAEKEEAEKELKEAKKELKARKKK